MNRAERMQSLILRGIKTQTDAMVANNDTNALRGLAIILRDFSKATGGSPNINLN